MAARTTPTSRIGRAFSAVIGITALFAVADHRPQAAQEPQREIAAAPEISATLRAQCLGAEDARLVRHLHTGAIRFVGTEPGRPIPQPFALDASASPEAAARGYLSACGSLFGLEDHGTQLAVANARIVDDGMRSVVRFRQVHAGIPVLGGELIVHLDDAKNILVVVGEVLPKPGVQTAPVVDAAAAAQTALTVTAKTHDVNARMLRTTPPELWLYQPALLGPSTGPTILVWRMEVTPREQSPIRELVLVDATRGSVPLHFNQVHTALQRQTYTANNGTTLPGTLVCDEANPGCSGGDSHAVAAHLAAGDTHAFYQANHGRDSINNAGLPLRQTVHYGSAYQNAFWDGAQMVYGDGFGFPLADDVVAHELTHGVTQYESNLFYYYQSGAINESFSDVWGEFVDQVNGRGTDTAAVKWLMGEDVSGLGATRDMKNPPAFSDPDKMTSAFYFTGAGDNGGVHFNSGINNKAVFLMVDGGTFNGITVAPLGMTKVAKIYYEVQASLLTSGADYLDLYDAVLQACTNLVGTFGITTADCAEARKATQAVEMHLQPVAGFNPDAPLCAVGQTPTNLFFDNLEAGAGNFAFSAATGTTRWQYDSPYGPYARSGVHFLYADDFPAVSTDSSAAMTTGVTLPANAYLHFAHAFGFETPNFDGGVVEYSTNGGASWADAGGLFDANGYRGTLSTANPLGARSAFIGESHGYISSRLNLSSLSGQTVRFRWRMGLDYIVYNSGWWVDDARIYSCSGTAPPPAPTLIAPDGATSTTTPSYTWNPVSSATWYLLTLQTPPASTLFTQWYTAAAACPAGGGACAVGPTSTPPPPSLTNGSSYVWKVQTWNPAGYGGESAKNFSISVPPPGAPTPVSPNGSIANGAPTYTWNRETGASSSWYLLEINTNPTAGSSANVLARWYQAPTICSGTTCSVTPSTASPPPSLANGPYKWRVTAWLGVSGPPSSFMTFEVNAITAAPPATTLISPTGFIVQIAPTYTFSKVGTATSYTFWLDQLADASGPGVHLLDRTYDASLICGATTCSIGTSIALPPPSLTRGKSYRWWVLTRNPVGNGPWSLPLAFTVGYPVTGRVTDAATSAGVANVWVSFCTSGVFDKYCFGGVQTSTTGDYTVGLLIGTYYAQTGNALGYINEVFDNIPCVAGCSDTAGTAIAVTTAGASGVNFALDIGGRIAGTLTNSTAAAIQNARVDIFSATGQYVTSGTTNASGAYVSDAGLSTGSYFARTANSQGYLDELYDNTVCLNCNVTTGTPIAVVIGAITGGIDFALAIGGKISGIITSDATGSGIGGVSVQIFSSTGAFASTAFSDAAGFYSSGTGLPTGTYYARTHNVQGYVNEAYNNIVCIDCSMTATTPIAVTAGVTTANVNFGLAVGGRIGGTITDAGTGAALASLIVDVYTATGAHASSGVTNSVGQYTVVGLPAGVYFARASHIDHQDYVDELYNNITCMNCNVTSGTPITVTSGTTTGGIDFALSRGGRVAGRVTAASTGSGLANVSVYIFSASGAFATFGRTDGSGNYTTFDVVPTGTYFARTFTLLGYGNVLYDNRPCTGSCAVTDGTPIGVNAPNTTININFALPTVPPAATLVSPNGVIALVAPTFSWNGVAGATWYQVSVTGPGVSFTQWYQSSVVCGFGCHATPPLALSNGAYAWRVQTFGSAGYGPWSASMSFTVTLPIPAAATLVSPSGLFPFVNTPTYTWNREATATWYHLSIRPPGGAATFARWYQAQHVCVGSVCSVGPTSTSAPPALAIGAHQWTIQTWNPTGYGPVSAAMGFTISPPGPAAPLTPTGTVTTDLQTYSWSLVEGSTWYYLWVNGPTGAVHAKWYEANDVCVAEACAVTPPAALSDGAYRWWVQTWSTVGHGTWSPPMVFTVNTSGGGALR